MSDNCIPNEKTAKIVISIIVAILFIITISLCLCIFVNPIDPNVMINNFDNVDLNDRVFNVGLGRTGTSSLADALTQLGYKVWHGTYYKNLKDDYFTKFNALTDTHVFGDNRPDMDFKKVFYKYPNTKFILTYRNNLDKWYNSVKKTEKNHSSFVNWKEIWTGRILGGDYKTKYGINPINNKPNEPTKKDYIDEYIRYNEEVVDFFSKVSPNSLLMFNVIDGKDGYEELCEFLEKPIPKNRIGVKKRYPKTDEIEITFKLSANKLFNNTF